MQMDWLKYSFGYSLPIFNTTSTSSSSFTFAHIQLLKFGFSPLSIISNFNLSLILYLIPVIGIIIFKILTYNDKYKKMAIPKY